MQYSSIRSLIIYKSCIVLRQLFENSNLVIVLSLSLSRHHAIFLCIHAARVKKIYLEANDAIEIQKEMESLPVVLRCCVVKVLIPSNILR